MMRLQRIDEDAKQQEQLTAFEVHAHTMRGRAATLAVQWGCQCCCRWQTAA